jgi:hypothetical protein
LRHLVKIEINTRRENQNNRAVSVILPQTKHVPTSGSMGSSMVPVYREMFEANVTTRFRIDDEHDSEEGKAEMVSTRELGGIVG